ncbi:hypothetical protein TRIP_C21101 [Candidatus Zixiibacteriota bacterium]|nr:hypothetical protein TRIP_C21101 [candidate division Zixibacteria bacterium]
MVFNKSPKRKVARRTPKPTKPSRFLELSILAIFILVLIYGASFALRINNGVSKTTVTTTYPVRIQILNGCGTRGLADRIAYALPKLVTAPVEASVVEVFDFKASNVKRSFLIAREADLTGTKKLAEQLGLPTDNIVYEPIENNYRSITATLVVGEDYNTTLLKKAN